jgi:hypothetical protein
MKYEKLLKDNGWEIECEHPFEIRHEDGSFATMQAAKIVLDDLKASEAMNDDESLSINFCTMSHDELMKIFELCDVMAVVDKSEMVHTFRDNNCIEKQWEYYDTLTVTPTEIKFSHSPYPSSIIMTAERYLKIKQLFTT